jgi:tRNA A-37 threonylcarbamoyl transferase component Bud32
MAFVEIHSRCRPPMARLGLAKAEDFLALSGVVCSGHLDRHVARVRLGSDPDAIPALLKREHRIRWRDRLANALAGFGFVSKSRREFAFLTTLEANGIGCPQAIAAGEDNGRAFLLIRELSDWRDLRKELEQLRSAPLCQSFTLARKLGETLAEMHGAGVEHRDLYSKHVLVRTRPAACPQFCFLDWQRGRQRGRLNWANRWRDLAALDATLAGELASPRLRLQALRAYLKRCAEIRAGLGRLSEPRPSGSGPTLAAAAHEIRRLSLRLQQRRRIREMRQPPLPLGTQNLIWIDGEALQVTREFRDELGGQIPDWLRETRPAAPLSVQTVPLPGLRFAELVTRWANRPWRCLWAWLRRQPVVAPELESMKTILRLERYGVVMPRLLAAGQKRTGPWQMESFLLTEPRHGSVPLPRFLQKSSNAVRRQMVRRAATVLRQMHQATCYGKRNQPKGIGNLLAACPHDADGWTVALHTVHGIEKCQQPNPMRAQRDLASLVRVLSDSCTRSDLLAGLMAYTGKKHLTPGAKRFAQRVLERVPAAEPRRRAVA